jgi:antitoxin component YwqK of YwqJK toxin-antitoxin module
MYKIILFLFVCSVISCAEIKKKNSYEIIESKDGNIQSLTLKVSSIDADSVRISFFENGTIDSIVFIKNDHFHGYLYSFSPYGHLMEQISHKDGLRDGYAFVHYESGFIQHFRPYKNGKKAGWGADYYDSAGFIQAVAVYNDEGQCFFKREFAPSGEILSTEGEQTYGKYY